MARNILDAKFDKFIEDFSLQANSENINRRRFVNYHYFSQFQPGRLDTDADLLDQICVSSQRFSQVNGALFLLNDQIISEPQDIDDILQNNQKGLLELYFLTFGDVDSFMRQLEELWNDLDAIEEDEEWIRVLAYAVSKKVMLRWSDNPRLRIICYECGESDIEMTFSDAFRECFSDIEISRIDKRRLQDIVLSNENSYRAEMKWESEFLISNEMEQFGNAYIVCLSAHELLKLMKTKEGLLRRNMFDDNVRDWQGDTAVNKEILFTLKEYPERFVLFNNGITIVCQDVKPEKGKYVLENPQIVNGCQTCNMIYQADRKGVDLDSVQVIAKIVGSNKNEVTQGIVRGANRQNIVYEEAFETIKEFHKNLEKYFENNQIDGYQKIYYERRSRQYASNVQIKQQQKISFRSLIQSMVALFLGHVEDSHRHEYTLLKKYKNNLFVDAHPYQPYYLAAFLYLNVDALFREGKLPKELCRYKMHIILLVKEMAGGPAPDLASGDIDKYCERLLENLENDGLRQYALEACKKFEDITSKWIERKGQQYKYGIKDSIEFRSFLMKELYGAPEERSEEKLYTGYVATVSLDKRNTFFGFIEHTPKNIFFHEFDNPDIDRSYIGKKVSFKITRSGGRERAVNVKLMS